MLFHIISFTFLNACSSYKFNFKFLFVSCCIYNKDTLLCVHHDQAWHNSKCNCKTFTRYNYRCYNSNIISNQIFTFKKENSIVGTTGN